MMREKEVSQTCFQIPLHGNPEGALYCAAHGPRCTPPPLPPCRCPGGRLLHPAHPARGPQVRRPSPRRVRRDAQVPRELLRGPGPLWQCKAGQRREQGRGYGSLCSWLFSSPCWAWDPLREACHPRAYAKNPLSARRAVQVRNLARSFAVPGDHYGQVSAGHRWPYGATALITPFNFPLEIPLLQLMGALYMGNKARRAASVCFRIFRCCRFLLALTSFTSTADASFFLPGLLCRTGGSAAGGGGGGLRGGLQVGRTGDS